MPLNWRLAAPELAYQLDDAEPAVLLAADEHADDAPRRSTSAARRSESLATDSYKAPSRRPRDDDGLLLVYTSGTTGQAEGRAAHARELLLDEPLLRPRRRASPDDDVVLAVLPQFHCGGWNVQPLLAWWKGATRRARAALRRRLGRSR